jgi:T5SS/PEP-CTERM-associated repeat protein
MARFVTLAVALIAVSSSAIVPAFAATKNWNDGTEFWTGVGGTGSNWFPVGVPVAGDIVNITPADGTPRTVTYDYAGGPITLGTLTVDLTGAGADSTTLSIPAGNLTSSVENVGYNGRGILDQSGGTNTTTGGINIGYNLGSNGAYYLSGSGVLAATGDQFIGYSGTGALSITGGGRATNANGDLGVNSGSIGAATVDGSGSRWTNNSVLAVGASGAGTLSITNGGYVSSFHGRIGRDLGSTGIVVLDGPGSTWQTTQDLTVGGSGTASLTIQNGALTSVGNNLSINGLSAVNLAGGTLRFNTAGGLNRLNYTSGTIQLAGARNVGSDSVITALYGSTPTISTGKTLAIEGAAKIGANTAETVVVNAGQLTAQSSLQVGGSGSGVLQVVNGGTLIQTTTDGLNIGASTSVQGGSVLVSGTGSSITLPNAIGVGWFVNASGNGNGSGSLVISAGAKVNTPNGGSVIGGLTSSTPLSTATVTGPGSVWTCANLNVGYLGAGTLNIQDGALVSVGSALYTNPIGTVNLNGGTLRFSTLYDSDNRLNFNSGTIQLAGDRGIGSDATITRFFGAIPTIAAGKGLAVEGTATIATAVTLNGGTLRANSLAVNGSFFFGGGLLELTGGAITGLTSLAVPTGGEFRARGVQSLRMAGAAGSTITATGDLTLGNAAAVNGFGTQGTLQVGANNVTLLDANDVVFDSLALATLGAAGSPGTLDAANGLTVDFGGNISGFGTVSTPNDLAKPLINNGHITGDSVAQPITLPGYVKGVGTFDNVVFTGTFSPGLSPAILTVGNVAMSPTSTLIMELGGTLPGSGYDRIQSSGTLALDGVLKLSLINGFTPMVGQTFDLFSGASVVGAFSSVQLPVVAGLSWNAAQLASGILSLQITGDYNGDGIVDAADYTVWRDSLGQIGTGLAADGDGNGVVDQADFDVWSAHFGEMASTGSGASASSVTPEPTTLSLIATFLFCISLQRLTRTDTQHKGSKL